MIYKLIYVVLQIGIHHILYKVNNILLFYNKLCVNYICSTYIVIPKCNMILYSMIDNMIMYKYIYKYLNIYVKQYIYN